MNHDIFVSYSSTDKAIADAVVAALEQQNFRCWYAPRDIKPSADWGDSITEAISGCKIVLLIFSGSANQSQRVRDEIYYAISEEKVILPFRIENLDPTGAMRLHLSSRHWLDAFQPSWQAHLERLVASVADTMGRSLVQPLEKAEPAPREVPPAAAAIPLTKPSKKVPWLWIGLVVVVVGLSVAGVLWLQGRGDGNEQQPTEISAEATSTSEQGTEPTAQPTPLYPDEAVFYPRNGHAYLYVDENLSWYEAKDTCASMEGHLATVQDAAENIFIFSLTNAPIWLGATDEEEEGRWVWVSGEPWGYTNWGWPNPDNWQDEEHYLGMGSAGEIAPTQWNDSKDEYMPFVCEWEPSAGTPAALGKTIVVTSMEDSGEGSLRQALLDAQAGDIITFDPAVFPLENGEPIYLQRALPQIRQGFITLDATNRGVALNGEQLNSDDWTPGLEIASNYNVIQGLGIVQFPGPGVLLDANVEYNLIGGDRTAGPKLWGEGNLILWTSDGIAIMGAKHNVIAGNVIGTNDTGTAELGNRAPGIFLEGEASGNLIGPDNLIAYNGTDGGGGIEIRSVYAQDNIITANRIYNNNGQGIAYNINEASPFTYSSPPVILYYDLYAGIVQGQTCPGCIVEIFSTETEDGKIFEGTAWTDEYGYFHYQGDKPLAGPYLTATSRLPGENTSEFSLVASARTDIQQVFATIQDKAPVYQTGFNTWDFDEPQGNGRELVEGKLVMTDENGDRAGLFMSSLSSDRFAVEFEFRFWDAEQEGAHCAFETYYEEGGRAIIVGFSAEGLARLDAYIHPGQSQFLSASKYDETITNKVMLIVLGDQMAAFMNGKFAYTVLNPNGIVVYTDQALSANGSIVCEYDNFKVWDLSGLDLDQ